MNKLNESLFSSNPQCRIACLHFTLKSPHNLPKFDENHDFLQVMMNKKPSLLPRIHRRAFLPCFKMEVAAGRRPGGADSTNDLSLNDGLTFDDIDGAHMSIESFQTVTVVDHHIVAVSR